MAKQKINVPSIDMDELDEVNNLNLLNEKEFDEMEPQKRIGIFYMSKKLWEEYEGVAIKAYYRGSSSYTNKKGEEVDSALFQSDIGNFFACQHIITESVKSLEQNTPVQITFLGIKETAGGNNLCDFQIHELG